MTGSGLLLQVQYLLRDTGRGLATQSRVYDPSEILSALTGARAQVFADLVDRPQLPRVSLGKCMSRLTGIVPGTTPAPGNLYRIIYGTDASGQPVPSASTIEALAFKNAPTYASFIGIVGGIIQGTATSCVFYKYPSQPIQNTNGLLSEFGDAVYNCVKYQAVLNLLLKERADVLLRYQFLQGEYKRKFLSLK